MAVRHPVFARLYPRLARAIERGSMATHRQALLAGLADEVIEIGAGRGANFAHYPTGVTRVLAVEAEPHLREGGPPRRPRCAGAGRGRRRARRHGDRPAGQEPVVAGRLGGLIDVA